MVIYGIHKEYLNNSFIVKKLNNLNVYWDYKFFSDHINNVDFLKMIKSLIKDKVIFFSLESSVHSYRYWRPYSYSDFNISHKDIKKCIYYNIFAEDYLNGFLKKRFIFEKKFENTIFIASNSNKIKYIQNLLGKEFSKLSFYGLFGNKVKLFENNFHLDAQNLIGQHKSAICVENSDETGYIQGNFLFALLSGTVPIVKASRYILKNILLPECYIEIHDYISMTELEKNININKKSNYILSGKEVFTNLAKDYLQFINEINLSNISASIKESQNFKKKIFNL